MKNFVLSTVLLFSFNGEAQLETVVEGLNSPIGISIYEDRLYVAEFKANQITSINYDHSLIKPWSIVDDIFAPVDIIVRNNMLYIAEFGSKKVSMVDLVESGPNTMPLDVAVDLKAPVGIAFYGNNLYIAEFDANKISRTDVTRLKPNNEDFLVNLNGPSSLVEYDGYIYFTEKKSGTISRVDVSSKGLGDVEVLLTGLDRPIGLAIRRSKLYFTEEGNAYVSEVDINSHILKPVVLTEIMDVGARLEINGDDLYISQRYSGDILRFSLLQLGIGEREGISEMAVYPNPTKRFVSLNEMGNSADIQLLTINGEVIFTKEIRRGEKIDLSGLDEGIYFLRINELETVRIQKVD